MNRHAPPWRYHWIFPMETWHPPCPGGEDREGTRRQQLRAHSYTFVATHYAEIIHFIAVALVYKSQDFLFDGKRRSPHGLSAWGSNPDTHISGVMLYQLHELPSPQEQIGGDERYTSAGSWCPLAISENNFFFM